MRLGIGDIDPAFPMAHPDRTGVHAIIAIEHAQQGRFAGAREPGQSHASTAGDGQSGVGEHRDLDAALGVQEEALADALNDDALRVCGLGWRDHGALLRFAGSS